MQIVIDISEELYKNVIEHTKRGYMGSDVWIAVANGTPLPKGHGDLIDRDELSPKIHGVKSIVAVLDAPTIIEADK